MKQVFNVEDKEITIYTDRNVLDGLLKLIAVPNDTFVVAQIHGKKVGGSPSDIIREFQSLQYAIARKEGFEGTEEFEDAFGMDAWNV